MVGVAEREGPRRPEQAGVGTPTRGPCVVKALFREDALIVIPRELQRNWSGGGELV